MLHHVSFLDPKAKREYDLRDDVKSPDKSRGFNAAVIDMGKGIVLEPSELVAGPDYVDGYREGQDSVLFERSLARESAEDEG